MSSETTYQCMFCLKLCKNSNSLRNHQRLCKSNPNRDISNFEKMTTEQIKNMRHGAYISEESKQKTRDLLKQRHAEGRYKSAHANRKGKYIGPDWTEEKRERQSEIMKRVSKENPESYSSSNRGRTKQIEKYGIKFQGSWELTFYEFCLENHIECLRNYNGFDYIWNGNRTYYPDFYLPQIDSYVEIKGYKTERDVAKWSYFPKNLVVIQRYEIKLMQKNLFKINDLY